MKPPIGVPTRFCSDALPERDRLALFVEEFARKEVQVEVDPAPDTMFRSTFSNILLGPVACSEIEITAGRHGRSRQLIKDGNDDFMLFLNTGNVFDVEVQSSARTVGVPTDRAALTDNATDGKWSSNRDMNSLSITVQRQYLRRLVPRAEDLLLTSFELPASINSLMRGYIEHLLGGPALPHDVAAVVGNHLVDLVVLALGAVGDSAQEASNGGLRAARYVAARETINARLRDGAMSLGQVASLNGISERNLQRLFEDAGTSFTEYVSEQRLLLAHRLLSNPLLRHRRIIDIANECGFNDLSHFNRSFRRRFGATPSDVRETVADRRG